MAHLNDTIVHGILDVTDKIVLTSKKYNVTKYNDGLILGDTSIATQLVGNGITIDSESILKLLAARAKSVTVGGNSTETVTGSTTRTMKGGETEAVTGNSSKTVSGNLSESADGSASITGKTGTTITGNGTTGVKLVGTRLCVPNASYGTGNPPSGAQTGEVYFKIIS